MIGGLNGGGRLLLILSLPVLIYFAFETAGKAIETYELKKEQRILQREIRALEERNAELQSLVEYLKSDDYVEKVAREQLNLIKPGEKAVVVVTPPRPDEAPSEKGQAAAVDTQPNWKRWWDFFFGP